MCLFWFSNPPRNPFPSHRDAGGRQPAALSALGCHIRGITALAIAFVVVGVLIRLGGVS
jgi:hypothetical protein